MEDRASIVVIGAGIVGCNVADQLTQLGWRDVVVIDQGPLFEAGGSTSHAPGLVFQTNPSKTMTELARYGVKRYSELELDGQPGFYPVGGIEVAATPERWKDLERKHGLAASWGLDPELISPKECAEKVPLLKADKVYGGFFVPDDGITKGVRVSEAAARQAMERGERVGLIRFGSRLDVYLPEGTAPRVAVGQKMVAGETVLAVLGQADAPAFRPL